MITLILTPNALEPLRREIMQLEAAPGGSRLRSLLPPEWAEQLDHVLAFVDGRRVEDWDSKVDDEQTVLLGFSPSGGTVIALIGLAVSLIGAGVAIAVASQEPDEPVVENPDGSATYGFYGFQNTYQAEGAGLPIVYGVMRTAPPCINQFIAATSAVQLAGGENLYNLLAVSEGPIAGFGDYEGTVESFADLDALVGSANASQRAGLQINGIASENLNANMSWRTGTLNQTAMNGELGQFGPDGVAQSFVIQLTPITGTAGIDETTKPPGSYSSSSDLITDQADEFVSQNILQLADRAVVSIAFERGLFKQDGSGGFETVEKTVRIQYTETDSGGTPLGNTVLLPAFVITAANRTTPAIFDVPFDFRDPATYAPAVSQGFARLDSVASDYLKNNNSQGLQFIRQNITASPSQTWSMAAWVRARDTATIPCSHVMSWSQGSVTRMTAGQGYRVDPGSVGSSDIGHSISLIKDEGPQGGGAFGAGAGNYYLVLEVWNGNTSAKTTRYHSAPLGGLADNTWRHIGVTFAGPASGVLGDLPTVTFYVDGVPSAGVAQDFTGQQFFLVPAWTTASSEFYLGSFEGATSSSVLYRTKVDVCDVGIQSGLVSSATMALLGSSTIGVDEFGNKIVGARQSFSSSARFLLPCDTFNASVGVYPNIGGGINTALFNGAMTIQDVAATPQTTGAPLFRSAAGDTRKSYWNVEVFVSDPQLATSDEVNQATIDTITALRSQEFEYPHTAVAAVRVQADNQVENARPTMTMLVKGRVIRTWDGTLNSQGEPAFVERLSSNPAWIAADLLTHKRYGLGSDFSDADIDWQSFLDWAYFCDEGVPDAFGTVDCFGVEIMGTSVDAEFQLVKLYVGIQTTGGAAAESIPQSWQLSRLLSIQTPIGTPPPREFRAAVSITDVTAGGVSSEWITADDLESGLNEASNRLDIYSIEFKEDSSGFHGFSDYAEVLVRWNREDSLGDPIWPQGLIQGDEFFADELGISTLLTTSGYEARCRFDGVFDQAEKSAWEAVISVFGAGRAMPMKSGAIVYAVVDQPRPAVAVFGQGDIVPDSLKVSYTGEDQIPNSLEGDILDSQANFERRTILVDHPSIQDPSQFGTIRKETSQFFGVTRRSQAIRDATLRLNKYHAQKKSVSFQVGPDAVHLLPGDRFKLSHDVPEYGVSGRLRGNSVIANFFPGAGSFFRSWDAQGGTCSLSSYLLAAETTDPLPTGFTSSQVPVSFMWAVPTGPDGEELARAGGHDGSDYGTGFSPSAFGQHVTTSNALYPPSGTLGPLDFIRDVSTFSSAYSVFVKEPTKAAAKTIYVNFYRLVDQTGAPINHTNLVVLNWAAGALSVTSSDASVATTVESIGSGWYRIKCVYTAALDTGAQDFDFLQVRTYVTGQGTGAVFKKVADGGRGINFLKHADPLDVTRSDWTLANATTGTNSITNTAVAPPFYTATDGSYGFVTKIRKDPSIAFGTTPPAIIQSTTLNPGGIISTWNGERVNVSFYAKLDAANQANNTAIYVDLRSGTGTDGDGMLNGDGVRAVINASSSPWSLGVLSVIASSGTVANQSHAVTPVYQNSIVFDPDWYRIDVSFDYTPSSGLFSVLSLGIFTDGGGTASGGAEAVDVWGVRLHGRATAPSFIVNDKYHQGALFWGAMYEKDATSVGAFSEGASIKLDRDITLEAGNSYELLLRSSFSPDVGISGDALEVVSIDGTQVPTSGSSTIAANSDVLISTPEKFVAREGDLYSFGKVDESSEDFVVQSITFDAETMRRDIMGLAYDESVYNDTAFGTQGVTTVSETPSTESAGNSAADTGIGLGEGNPQGARGFRFSATLSPTRDRRGGTIQQLVVSWQWPQGQRKPRALRVYYAPTWSIGDGLPRPEPTSLGDVAVVEGYGEFMLDSLTEGTTYDVFLQPIGWRGTFLDPRNCPQVSVVAGYALQSSQLSAPELTVTTRGFEQVYELAPQDGDRTFDVVEGRLGGWIMATPIFLLDPDSRDLSSNVTLVGQASTPTGRTGMIVRARKRLTNGAYGEAQEVESTEQLADVTYTHSTANENDYATTGVVPIDFDVTNNVMSWDPASSALSAYYIPAPIDLGEAKRVLANCGVEAYQIRPETWADCDFTWGDATGRRWSWEGPMDNIAGDNSSVQIEWRWTSASGFTTETYRLFRPGEVYARLIEFKIKFTRPSTDYNMKVVRVLTQALGLPAFEAGDIDGGTF